MTIGCEGVVSNGLRACSHGRSFELFKNAIRRKHYNMEPLAYYCDSYEDFMNGVCLGREECLSDDQDFTSVAIDGCSVSFDILYPFNELPKGLQASPNKLFFATRDVEPFFGEYNLICIVSK